MKDRKQWAEPPKTFGTTRTKRVKVSLSADEMNGDNITVIFSDAAGAEWYDLTVNIQTITAGRQFEDLALASTLGTPAGASVSADIADLPTVAEFEARTLVAARAGYRAEALLEAAGDAASDDRSSASRGSTMASTSDARSGP